MAQRDNVGLVLMTHCNVNLLCDNEKLELRYRRLQGNDNRTWICNGEDTELQCLALIQQLKSKYKSIKVLWKRQF